MAVTCSPNALCICWISTEHGFVPGAEQVTDLLSITVIHVAMDLILLRAPVASLCVGCYVCVWREGGREKGRVV